MPRFSTFVFTLNDRWVLNMLMLTRPTVYMWNIALL